MRKIKVTLQNIRENIKNFYDEKLWHFITLNGVALEDSKTEIQWIFSKYESLDDVVIYYVEIDQNEKVPSIVDMIPSAIISQREIVDMFGVEVDGSEKGLYLDSDSTQMPLSSCEV
ncbi:MAG: NADH-quinone oxidoreductase subunit C [Campylobacterota bacterium]|nr:NADH-quinone oxidoreductase subunit C [Campylobacterota bacterium]